MKKKTLWILVTVLIVILLALPKVLPLFAKPAGAPGGGTGGGKGPAAVQQKAPGAEARKAGDGGSPAAGRRDGGPAAQGAGGGRGGPTPVTAMIVKPQPLSERIAAPGTILANEAVELKSETSGRLVSLSFREGARVSKGTLLAKINDADLQAQLQKANATLKLAQDKAARQKGLLEKEVISREDYESVMRDLEAAKADVALLAAQIEKTEVRAPFDGRLGLRYVSEGAYLQAGTRITTLVSDRPLKVDFAVPEKYAGRIRTGHKVVLTAQAGSRTYNGAVYAIDPMIEESTRSLRLRALVDGADEALAPGSFAEVRISLGENSRALMVPSPALVPEATGQKVFLVKNGAAVAAAVTTGIRDSVLVEITSGLKPGDTVITTGVLLVRNGAPVLARVTQ